MQAVKKQIQQETDCESIPIQPPRHNPSRRKALAGAALLLASIAPLHCAWAQAGSSSAASFPTRPVTVITAFAVGSGPDAVLRIVGENWPRAGSRA